MSDWLDQIFIRIKQVLLAPLAGAPDWVMQIVSSLINIFALLGVFLTLFALIPCWSGKFSDGCKIATGQIASGRSDFFNRWPTASRC